MISDDEPDEQLGRMDDDWTQALWDDLIKDNSENWDMRDAFKHGKQSSQQDPSSNKKQRPWNSDLRENGEKTADERLQTKPQRIFIDAREWDGRDLNQAVLEERLTVDQSLQHSEAEAS